MKLCVDRFWIMFFCVCLLIVSGNVDAAGHNPEGYLDSVVSNAGNQITVTGWAFDRDDVNKQLEIHVYVGGGTGSGAEGYRIIANKYRPDVNRAFPGVGDYHGFNETINVNRTGNQPVYVYAINIGGGNSNPELGHPTVNIISTPTKQVTSHDPQGYLDSVVSNARNQITVTGWAFDRDDVNKQLEIHVYVGGGTGSGAEGYRIIANKYRPDVNRALPGVGDYHGFNETINVNRTGNQPVYVYAINIGGGNSNPELGHPTVDIQGGFQPYQATARQTGPAFHDAGLKNRTGNERVDAGDICTILKQEGNAWFVDYPAGNTRKQRWVDKKIFESSNNLQTSNNLQNLISVWKGKKWDNRESSTIGKECFGFANYIFRELHGVQAGVKQNGAQLGSISSGVKHLFLTYDATIDKNAVDEVFRTKVKSGDFIISSRPHSMIFDSYDANTQTVWIFDANWIDRKKRPDLYNLIQYRSMKLDSFVASYRQFSIYTR